MNCDFRGMHMRKCLKWLNMVCNVQVLNSVDLWCLKFNVIFIQWNVSLKCYILPVLIMVTVAVSRLTRLQSHIVSGLPKLGFCDSFSMFAEPKTTKDIEAVFLSFCNACWSELKCENCDDSWKGVWKFGFCWIIRWTVPKQLSGSSWFLQLELFPAIITLC